MARKPGKRPKAQRNRQSLAGRESRMRIIGGRFRGSLIQYHGDPQTRPMKDRVREAVYNLVGTAVRDKLAIDLFAGTGALGLEAISRGAKGAIFLERHFPTARLIERNVTALGLDECCHVVPGDTFLWLRREIDWVTLCEQPWLVLCSPPYDFYLSRQQELIDLLSQLRSRAPCESLFVVESDRRFDFRLLEELGDWDVREYLPAVVGVLECDLNL